MLYRHGLNMECAKSYYSHAFMLPPSSYIFLTHAQQVSLYRVNRDNNNANAGWSTDTFDLLSVLVQPKKYKVGR